MIWWCGVSAGLWPAAALAQANPSALREPDTIVVVATPLTEVGEGALAAPAQTASDEEIEASHAADLTEYLKRFAGGVFVNEVQGNPLQPDVQYRGFTASPLLGTPQGLSVYLDGVRFNQPFGDVVAWDLIPRSAIRSVSLVPAVNPLFGRNSLGGALAIRTKDGRSDPGFELEAGGGSFGRRTLEGQAGGRIAGGFHWFASGDFLHEDGWRQASPSRAVQAFAKLGWADADSDVAVSGSLADSDLNGNGLQEMRLLAADRTSYYTAPDATRNRGRFVELAASQRLSGPASLRGNLFWRDLHARTTNGDVNEGALGENLTQPDATERAALAAAGYGGVPTSGETQANTPFPKWRCIANVLLNAEPNEKCDGLVNRSETRQSEWGVSGELAFEWPGRRLALGLVHVRSKADFAQTSQFGYLLPDRTVMPVAGPGAFADGTQDSENAFDARVDLHATVATFSGYALAALDEAAWHLELSGRYDRTVLHNRDRISPGGGTGSLDADVTYARFNPALSLRWTPRAELAFDAGVSQTSRAPSAVELGCSDPASPCRLPNALAGDPPLREVVARTIELGMNARIGGAKLRIGAFRTVNRDDILFVADAASGFGYFRNFGRTRRQGIDLDLSGRLGRLRLAGHYTLLDATYRSAETVGGSGNSSNDGPAPGFDGDIAIAPGDRIPLIPRHVAKASVNWEASDRLALSLDLLAVSGALARGNENGQHRPDGTWYLGPGGTTGHAVVNAGIEFRPVPALTLHVQVENLFDKAYASAAQLGATAFDAAGNVVARPFAGPVIGGERPLLSSTFYAPGAPRSLSVGARVRF